jgi:predicted nucleotidyltransferase
MNLQTEKFIDRLKQRQDVLGVILFGSWVRGNNRPESDVDLVVIIEKGHKRAVENHDGQVFEIIYTTEVAAYEFWEENKDDAFNLWDVAKIVYDKTGVIKTLQAKTEKMLKSGKKVIDDSQWGQLHFDAEDQVEYSIQIYKQDPVTANLMLNNKVFALTELFFDIRQRWTPAPKQRIEVIKQDAPEFYSSLEEFYMATSFDQKASIAKKIIKIVFGK